MSYHFIENKEDLHRALSLANEIAQAIQDEVRNNDLPCQIFLIGSGARNMVTANNNEPFDFDFNLNILSCENWNDGRTIKEVVRKAANKIMREYKLNDFQDSTSSLTSDQIWFKDRKDIIFTIDIGIVTKDVNGRWNRLIHEKTGLVALDRYYWNNVRNSERIREKAIVLKQHGFWKEVRQRYLDIKNRYLSCQDQNHPSFVCYIEAVNEIYQKYFKN